MRSQKQSNRSPRPFKNQFSEGKHGGAGRNMGFIPSGDKFAAAKKKAVPAPLPADASSLDETAKEA